MVNKRRLRQLSSALPMSAFQELGQQLADAAIETKERAAAELKDALESVGDSIRESVEEYFDQRRDFAASKVSKVGSIVHQAAHALQAVKLDPIGQYVDE